MEFKDKLRALRKERGLSQQALADAIFVSRSAVAKWENGLGLPCEESFNALLDYFGVTRDYFKTEQPEAVIVEKNRLIRRLAVGVAICVLILLTAAVLFAASIPVVNDRTAAAVADRLVSLPLPEDTELVESLSQAGKLVGNGNGMQYLGVILIRSGLSPEELDAYYAPYRQNNWDCLIRLQEGRELDIVEHGSAAFQTEPEPDGQYYIVCSWGTGIEPFTWLDLRGH